MNVLERAHFALEHFMQKNSEKTEKGYRIYFSIEPFPNPSTAHNQWDDGDGTSRALDAWIYLRRITGDYETGKEIEEGQWIYLRSLINSQNGLVYVGDHSHPNQSEYYYHMWDQGRFLRHLINRYQLTSFGRDDKYELEKLINTIINSLNKLSCETVLESDQKGRYWEHDVFWNEKPVTPDMDFGELNYMNFTMVNAQLLDPAVKWASVTRNKDLTSWAIELALGFIAGLETRRESTSPMFGKNGEFKGHFHCVASGLVGMVRLSEMLFKQGNIIDSKYYLNKVIGTYKWIFSEENINRGSSFGWFPENSGEKIANTSEICCTADMIELASALASIAYKLEGYEFLDNYWDDVDRFTTNELFSMQILNPTKFAQYVKPGDSDAHDRFSDIAKLYTGGWPFGHNWPHDLMSYSAGLLTNGKELKAEMPIAGCCLYSGPRGLYAYWNSMVDDNGSIIDIRFPGRFENQSVDIHELDEGGLSLFLKRSTRVAVRIPKTADAGSVKVFCGGERIHVNYNPVTRRVAIACGTGTDYSICWKNLKWESHETLGMENTGHIQGKPTGSRVMFTLLYHGNKLADISPSGGALLPYSKGL